MDESHLRSAVSYVSLNPVRARLVSRAEERPWSNVPAHLAGEDDSLVSVRPVLERWATFRDLLLEECEEKLTSLREAEGIGRPLGTAGFVIELERRLGRPIARCAPGRKAVAIPVGEQLNLLQSVSCHRIRPWSVIGVGRSQLPRLAMVSVYRQDVPGVEAAVFPKAYAQDDASYERYTLPA